MGMNVIQRGYSAHRSPLFMFFVCFCFLTDLPVMNDIRYTPPFKPYIMSWVPWAFTLTECLFSSTSALEQRSGLVFIKTDCYDELQNESFHVENREVAQGLRSSVQREYISPVRGNNLSINKYFRRRSVASLESQGWLVPIISLKQPSPKLTSLSTIEPLRVKDTSVFLKWGFFMRYLSTTGPDCLVNTNP